MLAAILLGLVAGAVAGLAFFGGLAATVHNLPTSSRPAALMAASLLGRFVVLALILIGVAIVGTASLIVAVVGMLAVRFVLLRRSAATGPPGNG